MTAPTATEDMTYFHQATKRICSSLDIQVILDGCLDFFKAIMPLESIAMNVYDSGTQRVLTVATVGPVKFKKKMIFPPEAIEIMENDSTGTVDIMNRPERDFLGRFVWQAMGRIKMSAMVLKLGLDGKKLGVVVFYINGNDRYTQTHARLLKMVHDPFAMALSNTLRHQEVLRLKYQLMDDNQYLNRQLHHMSGDKIIGRDFGLKYVMEMVRQIAPQKSQVLLLGQTGTGKEVIANAIHYSSPRATRPFIKVNCGAIPDNLIDSELFGHERGAFTGALTQKRGRFERAHTGTLFLDEIGELPLQVQARLLRVLQNKEIERVGGLGAIPVDIRIIAATHRDLPKLVREGKFREDLWFRLNVFPITIPPLRQRTSDIPALTRFFIEKKVREMNFSRQPIPSPGALERLQNYHWPGNVRELENFVERTIIRSMAASPDRPLEFEDIPPAAHTRPVPEEKTRQGPVLLDEVMAAHIKDILMMTGGRVQGEKGAAALLGIHPNTLRNRMDKLKIPYGRKI